MEQELIDFLVEVAHNVDVPKRFRLQAYQLVGEINSHQREVLSVSTHKVQEKNLHVNGHVFPQNLKADTIYYKVLIQVE